MIQKRHLSLLILLFAVIPTFAQVLNDGPIELSVRVQRVSITLSAASDLTLDVGGLLPGSFTQDEYSIGIQAAPDQDITGIGFQGPTCLQADLEPPALTPDFNTILFTETYTTANVPEFFDLRVNAWEDDTPADFAPLGGGITDCKDNTSRCTFENSTCCLTIPFAGCVFSEGDDEHCDAPLFADNLDYRDAGPPCQWSSHGFVQGNCPSSNIYEPEIESFWRYTKGTACTPTDAIDLGTLGAGGSLTHFNSNECYTNNFANSPGQDVFYTFEISSALGVEISLCGSSTTFDTYLYLLDNTCAVDTFNDNGCSLQSSVSKALCNPGRYYVVVDGAAANEMGTFQLVINENPGFTFSATTATVGVSCNGLTDGEASATPSGGVPPYTYAWTGGLTDSMITGLAGGVYTVTVSDAEGCTTTATATVNEPAPVTVTTTAVNVSCGGATDGSATANPAGGTPPYTYIWTSNPPQTGQIAVLLGAGNYNVTVTDANGCTGASSASIQPTVSIVLDVASFNNVSCNGDNDGAIDLTISGGQAPYSFNWSNSATTEDLSGLGPGTYDVTVTDGAACFEDTSFTITEPSLLTSTINQTVDVSCNGETNGAIDLGVAGGTPLYTYSWSDASTGEELLNAAAGTYDVTITDAAGCTTTNSSTIAEPTAITPVITSTDEGCDGSGDGAATLAVSGGSGTYTYFWSNLETTQDITGLSAGTYTVVITDSDGCNEVANATISSFGALSLSTVITNATCQGDEDGGIDLAVSGGTSPYTYAWSNGEVTEDILAISTGAYEVTVTDNNTCTEIASYFVELSGAVEDCAPTAATGNYVAIPNVFSPNGDGPNDIFEFHTNGAEVVEVSIFDRVGELVYTNANQATGDGWNGNFKDDPAQEGTYVYVVNVTYTDGVEEQLTGSVTLIR